MLKMIENVYLNSVIVDCYVWIVFWKMFAYLAETSDVLLFTIFMWHYKILNELRIDRLLTQINISRIEIHVLM